MQVFLLGDGMDPSRLGGVGVDGAPPGLGFGRAAGGEHHQQQTDGMKATVARP